MLSLTYTTKGYRNNTSKMCAPYKYLITKNGCSYRAFVTTRGFKTWMKSRGLTITKIGKLYAKINGEFKTVYQNLETNPVNGGINSIVLHNGEYVPCVIKDGIEYVHHIGYVTADKYSTLNIEKRLAEYRSMSKIYG